MGDVQFQILRACSLVCAAFGVLALCSEPRHVLQRALPLALDFWLAAGLLRLSATSAWSAIVTAAAIVALRKLIGFTLKSMRAVQKPV
jgi:uncharacterized membrane protein